MGPADIGGILAEEKHLNNFLHSRIKRVPGSRWYYISEERTDTWFGDNSGSDMVPGSWDDFDVFKSLFKINYGS